jgi:hypothetical protein
VVRLTCYGDIPKAEMAELLGFGTYHVDRPKKVQDELGEIAEEADVILVENPRIQEGDDDKLDLLIQNPMMLIAGAFLSFFWGLFGWVLTRTWRPVDAHAVDMVSEEQEITVEPVDMNIVDYACDVGLQKTVFSWVVFILSVSLLGYGVISISVSSVLLGVILGFAPASIFARRTLVERDRRMSENIREIIISHENIETGCLVSGNGHLDGISEELAETEITVSKIHKSKFLRRNL